MGFGCFNLSEDFVELILLSKHGILISLLIKKTLFRIAIYLLINVKYNATIWISQNIKMQQMDNVSLKIYDCISSVMSL